MLTYAIRSSPNTYINLKIMVKRSSGKKCLKRGARANDLRLVRKKLEERIVSWLTQLRYIRVRIESKVQDLDRRIVI